MSMPIAAGPTIWPMKWAIDEQSLALLDWWETQLRDCYRGQTAHPVFIAWPRLSESSKFPSIRLSICWRPFGRIRRVSRYETIDDLLQYCRRSANPVGQLVLYLGECYSNERIGLADSICTGLQLANFCQDVAGDWDRGRIYLPQADCRRFGYTEAMFARRECNEAFRRLMACAGGSGRRFFAPGCR